MGYQPESADTRKLSRDVRCEGNIPYYRVVQPGTDPASQVKLGAAGCHVLGVTVWDPNYIYPTPDGILYRTGYYDGEAPMVAVDKVVPVEYGATITARQKLIAGTDGKAYPLVVPSGGTQLADLQALLLNGAIIGEAVDSGVAGDIKRVDLDKKI